MRSVRAQMNHTSGSPQTPHASDVDQMVGDALARLSDAGEIPTQVEVPYQSRPIAPLPESRRTAFGAHLAELVQNALELYADAEAKEASGETAPAPVLGQTCAACRGFCCLSGRESNAFIDAATIARVKRANPELDADEITALYLNHLPVTSVLLSCVYHGEAGCTLPRAMRSAICNKTICSGQRALVEAMAAAEPGSKAARGLSVIVTMFKDRSVSVTIHEPEDLT